MAIIQLSLPFKSFRGATSRPDGQVLYHSLLRDVSRKLIPPRNDRTPYQTAARVLFAELNALYSNVPDSEADGWKTLAAHFTHPDKNGNPVLVPAKSAFVSVNHWRVLGGQPPTLTAPVFSPLPGTLTLSNLRRSPGNAGLPTGNSSSVPLCLCGSDSSFSPFAFSPSPSASTSGWQLDFEWTGPPAFIALKNTPPLPGLRRQPKPCDYRFSTDDPTGSIFPITSPGGTLTILDSDSRFPIATGNRISLQAQLLNSDYILSQIVTYQSTVQP